MSKPVFVVFVRHGDKKDYEPDQLKYPGPGLTKKGKIEAKKTGNFLKGFKFDHIYCSDMTRAEETAREIKKHHRCKITYHRELAEFNKIVFNYALEKKENNKKKLKINTKRAILGRKFFKKILLKSPVKKILIVGHGNQNGSLISFGMGLAINKTPFFHFNNCSISSLMYLNSKIISYSHIGLMDHLARKKYTEVLNEDNLNKFLRKNNRY